MLKVEEAFNATKRARQRIIDEIKEKISDGIKTASNMGRFYTNIFLGTKEEAIISLAKVWVTSFGYNVKSYTNSQETYLEIDWSNFEPKHVDTKSASTLTKDWM